MARSLNKVQLIGNLTRDPELRYTPGGKAVCTLGLATNRSWTKEDGSRHEETEYHRIIVWDKLADLCAQLLHKGSKVYLAGRLATRKYTDKENVEKTVTEVIGDDMIVLDKQSAVKEAGEQAKAQAGEPEVSPDDIPF